jgi:hypothetical protein
MIVLPRIAAIFVLFAVLAATERAHAARFVETEVVPAGTFAGIDYVQYSGRFQGSTSLGEFDVPFEWMTPADPQAGNGIVIVEPSHFTLGPGVRDAILTRRALFGRRFSHATVGFGSNGLNVLDPTAAPIVIGGHPVENPGAPRPNPVSDLDIIVQFAQALKADAFAEARLGPVDRLYATGVSQTSSALESILLGPDGPGLFDMTQLVVSLWEPDFAAPANFPNTSGTFALPDGLGKVLFVLTEGDLLISNAEQYLNSLDNPDSRIYVIAGGAHQPLTGALGIRDQLPFEANGLDWTPVVRASFVAGDRWARFGEMPPADRVLESTDEIDPVYGTVTGIARDENLNALGGVRLPDVEVGRFRYIASVPEFELLPGLPGLVGAEADLECVPAPGGGQRFRFPAEYHWRTASQTMALFEQGLLLRGDAIAMIFAKRASNVGAEGRCDQPQ